MNCTKNIQKLCQKEDNTNQGLGSAPVSCGSGSRVLKTDPDRDPDPRPDF